MLPFLCLIIEGVRSRHNLKVFSNGYLQVNPIAGGLNFVTEDEATLFTEEKAHEFGSLFDIIPA